MLKPVLISGLLIFAFFCHYGCTPTSDEPKATVGTGKPARKDTGHISGNHSLIITAYDAINELANTPDSLANDSIDTIAVDPPGPISDTTGSPALQPEDSLKDYPGRSGIDPDKIAADDSRSADRVSQSRPVFRTFRKNLKEMGAGFFTSGLNFLTIVLLIILIFIAWQLHGLARRLSRLSDITRRLYSRSKSQRVIKDISLICSRLEKIESDIALLKASGMAPVNDGSDNPGPETAAETDRPVAGPGDAATPPNTGATGKPSGTMVFYMPSPDNEGHFDNRKKSDYFIPSESIYQFIMDENSDGKAIFSIYQDRNNMERAINYYSSILEKVCRGQNAFNPHGKTIKTIKPGHAVLRNNKWVVKEKALVRYE